LFKNIKGQKRKFLLRDLKKGQKSLRSTLLNFLENFLKLRRQGLLGNKFSDAPLPLQRTTVQHAGQDQRQNFMQNSALQLKSAMKLYFGWN